METDKSVTLMFVKYEMVVVRAGLVIPHSIKLWNANVMKPASWSMMGKCVLHEIRLVTVPSLLVEMENVFPDFGLVTEM